MSGAILGDRYGYDVWAASGPPPVPTRESLRSVVPCQAQRVPDCHVPALPFRPALASRKPEVGQRPGEVRVWAAGVVAGLSADQGAKLDEVHTLKIERSTRIPI